MRESTDILFISNQVTIPTYERRLDNFQVEQEFTFLSLDGLPLFLANLIEEERCWAQRR